MIIGLLRVSNSIILSSKYSTKKSYIFSIWFLKRIARSKYCCSLPSTSCKENFAVPVTSGFILGLNIISQRPPAPKFKCLINQPPFMNELDFDVSAKKLWAWLSLRIWHFVDLGIARNSYNFQGRKLIAAFKIFRAVIYDHSLLYSSTAFNLATTQIWSPKLKNLKDSFPVTSQSWSPQEEPKF